jgi:hypothetical protein
MSDPQQTREPIQAAPLAEEDRRSALMGMSASLRECISEAEGRAQVEECKLDYDMLVSQGPPQAVAVRANPAQIPLPLPLVVALFAAACLGLGLSGGEDSVAHGFRF